MSEYIIDIADYVPPFDPAIRTTSFGEQIVRCRDCKFSINDGMQCKRHKDSGWNGNAYCEEYAYVNPDGYCAWGERKDA